MSSKSKRLAFVDWQDLAQAAEACLRALPDYRGTIDLTAHREPNRPGHFTFTAPTEPGMYLLRVELGEPDNDQG